MTRRKKLNMYTKKRMMLIVARTRTRVTIGVVSSKTSTTTTMAMTKITMKSLNGLEDKFQV